jgi:hypothetical protein
MAASLDATRRDATRDATQSARLVLVVPRHLERARAAGLDASWIRAEGKEFQADFPGAPSPRAIEPPFQNDARSFRLRRIHELGGDECDL